MKQKNEQTVSDKVSEQRKERVFAAIRDFQQGRKQGHRSPHRGKRNRSSTLTYPLEF